MPAVRLIMSRTQVAMHFGHDQSRRLTVDLTLTGVKFFQQTRQFGTVILRSLNSQVHSNDRFYSSVSYSVSKVFT